MKTIELEKLSITKYFDFLKTIYGKKYLLSNKWHFLFEPELILRIDENIDEITKIRKFLTECVVSFVEYKYPHPKYDKQNRITKFYGDETLSDFTNLSLHLNSKAVLEMTGSQYERFIERTWHTMNNMAGHDWRKEGHYGLQLAKRRLRMDKVSMLGIILRLLIF